MQLFYNQHIQPDDKTIVFEKEESRHITKVLRKSRGDVLHITNGRGQLFEAKITTADPKYCIAEITSCTTQSPRKYKLHLAIAPTKSNDRFEWFLEKATEIGVDTITPILCANAERRVIKKERLEKIIQAALKQSLQTYLPELREMTSFSTFVKQAFGGQKFMAHCEDHLDRRLLNSAIEPNQEYLILIGPEGDFNVKEIEMALDSNFKAVSLGDTRLRTETAGIVACHTCALLNQI